MAFQGETTQIVKPKLLLCEGKEDARFFRAFLNHLAIVDFQVEDVGGKTNFRVVLSALVKRPDFATVASLGICRDADDQPLGAFQSLQNNLKANGLAAPGLVGEIADGYPRVGVWVLPDGVSTGMLEDLCLRAVENEPAYACVDEFFECVGRVHGPAVVPTSKARLHAWLATREDPEKRLGEAAESGYWPWTSSAFELTKQFLQSL